MTYCWIMWIVRKDQPSWIEKMVNSSCLVNSEPPVNHLSRDAKSQLSTGQELGIGWVWSYKCGGGLQPELRQWGWVDL